MSGNTERDERGQFESELEPEDIMSYFAEGRPFHTAQEVADRFDIDRSTAYRRLSRLDNDGHLEKVSLGSRTVVWWYTADTATAPDEVESDDPLFAAPTFTVDDPVDEDEIDDVLYGEIEG
ncbi:helix-turn-helix domain-containing protein [Natranaeroarchaeum aerophilus]|uniref:Helix-turn-helix domain-containing protein n=1 Tax=Natranaeroarchaeum aerophilus TaxID=2917711 RepID=A0AAE3K5L5_9EURY|nr:helix-turn-helix domain-containing protein [Natranaeroarchaeum aerophilus]MCL9813475.1 helix-turn-helix domain-containing protein [Natranaeroarchaeum aerophilus]